MLTFESNNKFHSIDTVEIDDIKNAINNLDPSNSPFVILERGNKDYIQCAGSLHRLSVELRIHSSESFKHFVIGRKEQSKIWSSIECKVGPINVLAHEVLDRDDAIDLFIHFFNTGSVLDTYKMRNVTKYYMKQNES